MDRYEQLVDIRGGERVDGLAHTYRFDNGSGYDIALTLFPDGDRVTVVTAPTVAALTAVDQDLELLPEGDDSGDDTTDESSGVTDGTTPADGTSDSDGDGESGDGTDGPDSREDRGSDATLTILILPVVGMAFLLVLPVLSTGQRQGR